MSESLHTVFPGFSVLDDLELVRLGLLAPATLSLPMATRLVDAEGVPVARVGSAGDVSWLGERSSRPYEEWHLRQSGVDGPAALIDDASTFSRLPKDVRTILVLASTDGEENAGALALVRAALAEAACRGCTLRIIPLGADVAQREDRIRQVVDALGGSEIIEDLSSPSPEPPPAEARGLVVLLTGLSGSGKSTLARALRNRLVEEYATTVTLLDGDVVRRHLSSGLGFSAVDRETNVLRMGWVAAEIARHGGAVVMSPIAPFQHTREQVARMVHGRGGQFVLVHVSTPLEECERRDRKGLYARARAGQIPDFTGISSPYEVPASPDLRLDTTDRSVDELVDRILTEVEPKRSHSPQEEYS